MAADSTFSAFRHRNFALLFAVNAVSNIGTWSQRVAQDWLVLELTGSGRDLGLVTGLQFLPTLVLSMLGGVLADRFNKRRLLIATNLGGGLAAVLLGMLVINGSVRLWHVFALAFALGVFSAIDAPIRQSFTSELVGKTDLANAVSLNSANFNAGRLIGPGLSGVMIAAFGTGPSFLLNAASFLTVVAGLLAVREADLHRGDRAGGGTTVREALDYVRSNPQISALLVVVFFGATFGLNYQMFNALMATTEFRKGPAEFGALGSVLAIGSLTGALITARIVGGRTPERIMSLAVMFGAATAALGSAPTYTVYCLMLPVAGGLAISTMVSANSYVQTHTSSRMRGRVMGIYLTVFMGGTPVGSPLVGWWSSTIGIRDTLRVCGAITIAAALAARLWYRKRIAKLPS